MPTISNYKYIDFAVISYIIVIMNDKNFIDKLNPEYMRMAILEARKNLIDKRGGPFGACIVRGDEVMAVARNTVLEEDATCHAEINAIRMASKKAQSYILSGCWIYSTTEPCPMCFSAIHWARIDAIIFGTSIDDVSILGFNELPIPDIKMKELGNSGILIAQNFLTDECRALLNDWNNLPDKKLY